MGRRSRRLFLFASPKPEPLMREQDSLVSYAVIVLRFLQKLEIELPYDPAIPLLSIHTEETRRERDTVMGNR